MQAPDEMLIRVHGEWDGWRSAEVRSGELIDVHWFQPNGAPHRLVHAFIPCTKIVTGDIPHRCERKTLPHRLRVCVLKRHTISTVYAQLARRADERGLFAANESPSLWEKGHAPESSETRTVAFSSRLTRFFAAARPRFSRANPPRTGS